MYFLHKDGKWIPVPLEPGDRLVIDGRSHVFRAVKRLLSPERIRSASLHEAAMGAVQPRWKRLWMMDVKKGKYAEYLWLPPVTLGIRFDHKELYTLIGDSYGAEALGSDRLLWEEDSDIGRSLLRQRSFRAKSRVAS